MKKIKILQQTKKQCSTALVLCAVFMLFFVTGKAQSENNIMPLNAEKPSFYKHEIGVSSGVCATPFLLPYYAAMNINLNYYYSINKIHSIGAGISFFNDMSPDLKFPNGLIVSPQINYRIIFYNIKNVSLFSSLSLGWRISSKYYRKGLESIGLSSIPTIHVTALGIKIGSLKDALTIEFGYGTKGMFTVGYMHNFINNHEK